ncbi:glycosyltransferase family 71 protein, partial [Piromyces sp. E2]
RGLVISTGNKHFKLARSTIDALRNIIHSKIPIEVIYYGDKDLSKENRKILTKYKNVYITDISSYFDSNSINIVGWAIKPFAILASRFEEVILIDADVMYLQDPLDLFDDPVYIEKGTLFFRDRTLFPGTNPAVQWVKSWMIDPLPETKALRFWNEISQHEMESSTVVINKTKNIVGLLSVCKLNEGRIRTNAVYKYVHGDKETFWMGFDMARQHYYINYTPAVYMGYHINNRICGHIGHMLLNGKIMFWNGHIVKDK